MGDPKDEVPGPNLQGAPNSHQLEELIATTPDPVRDHWREHVPTLIVPSLAFRPAEISTLAEILDAWTEQQPTEPIFTLGRASGCVFLWSAPSRAADIWPIVVTALDSWFGPRNFEIYKRVGRNEH